MLTAANVVKLCDFGISKGQMVDPIHSDQLESIIVAETIGTTNYMAPECFDKTTADKMIKGDELGGKLSLLR